MNNNKAPTSHSSTDSTYGLGTTANYGHVKTINALTQSSHQVGTALSAYQGYVLNSNKAAKSHASSATTYGVGTTTSYGHCKTIDNLDQSSHTNGYALSAHQGYVLNQSIGDINKQLSTISGEIDGLEESVQEVVNNGNSETNDMLAVILNAMSDQSVPLFDKDESDSVVILHGSLNTFSHDGITSIIIPTSINGKKVVFD